MAKKSEPIRVYILNTGGTLGMKGKPLRPAKSAKELMSGIKTPKGVEIVLVDFPRRQDSTNITHSDRLEMCQMIKENYEQHDIFILFHGTDSMAETAALINMAFKRSLQKLVFPIGAQHTKDEPGSDVKMQIENTLLVAVEFYRQKVVGVYNLTVNDVLDGSRLRKRAESDVNAFHTPGRYPVAKAWPHIKLGSGLRFREPVLALQGLQLDTRFERRVATFRVSADTPPSIMVEAVRLGKLKGVILECKGAGNIPDKPFDEDGYSWIDAIRMATEAGAHVGIISPFEDGRVVLERYELGVKAKKAGALSLESLTPDMGDVKFRHAIALFPNDAAKIQEFLSLDVVGELLPD